MINPYPEECYLEQNLYYNLIENPSYKCNFDLFRKTHHRLAWITQKEREILPGVNIISRTKEFYCQEDTKTINGLIKTYRKILKIQITEIHKNKQEIV